MENSTTEHCLKRVVIERLWGRFDIDWTLHPDVNILVGENGMGKSTVLKLVAAALSKEFLLRKEVEFEQVNIHFGPGRGQPFSFMGKSSLFQNGFSNKDFGRTKLTEIDFIETFEIYPFEKNGLPKTSLDHQLEQVTRRYLAWQSHQSNLVFTGKTTFEKAFERKTWLIETLNRLFKPTGKTVNTDEAELEFLVDGRIRIDRADLSSGEKQLLILLLTALCQEDKPAILLLDEPEISLHLRWQHDLIEMLRKLNPNCQLIIATHSPSIFNDGWRDRLFWMEDLLKKSPQPVAA